MSWLDIQLPGFLEVRRGEEGSLAQVEVPGGRHTLGERARERARSACGCARSMGSG